MRSWRFPLLLMMLALAACDDGEGWIVLQNETSLDIVAVYIDPCGTARPTTDRLAGGRIAPGRREAFGVPYGCYDVVAAAPNGLGGQWRVGVNEVDRRTTLIARLQTP